MRSIFRILKKRGSGGFTLIEMVVSVALIAVLLAGMLLFVTPVIQSFNDTRTSFTAENVATCVQEYITRTLRNANQVAIFTNTNAAALGSGTYATRITSMNSYCQGINGTNPNKTYLLKCISLRYEDLDGDGNFSYYMYDESVDMTSNGALNATGKKLIFSSALYKDLYLTYDFAKPANGDFDPTKAESDKNKKLRDDALEMTIQAFKDEGYNHLVFYGTGISELRQVKVMLAAGGKDTDYNLTIAPDTPLAFKDTVDGSRDIFIYYVIRQHGVV